MSEELISLEAFVNLKPIECPTRGFVDFPCVICKECEIGKAELTFGEGFLVETTVNSVLIHLMLDIQETDLFARYYLSQLKNSLSKIIPFIQKGDWDEGDLSILLTQESRADAALIDGVNRFLHDFPVKWRQVVIESSRVVKDIGDKVANKLAYQYFRELSNTRL